MSLPSFLSHISFFFKEKKKEIASAQTPRRLKSNILSVASQPLDSANQESWIQEKGACDLLIVGSYSLAG